MFLLHESHKVAGLKVENEWGREKKSQVTMFYLIVQARFYFYFYFFSLRFVVSCNIFLGENKYCLQMCDIIDEMRRRKNNIRN